MNETQAKIGQRCGDDGFITWPVFGGRPVFFIHWPQHLPGRMFNAALLYV